MDSSQSFRRLIVPVETHSTVSQPHVKHHPPAQGTVSIHSNFASAFQGSSNTVTSCLSYLLVKISPRPGWRVFFSRHLALKIYKESERDAKKSGATRKEQKK